MSEHLHLARKRTVFLYVIASIVCTVLYCIYCIYCIFTWYGLKQDDQLTVCQLFVNLQRTEHSRRDLLDERNACVHNNASNGNRQRNRRIYYAFGFCINRLKWSNKPVPSIQTMVWECQKKGHDTTIRSQNAEQLRENGWLRCSRTPQSFKTDIFYLGVWSFEFGIDIRGSVKNRSTHEKLRSQNN